MHRTLTIAGNPMNKVTGARSVFLGADKGSGGATVLKPSSVGPPSGTAAEDVLVASGRNVTLRVCRAVYPDKFPTPGVQGASLGKQGVWAPLLFDVAAVFPQGRLTQCCPVVCLGVMWCDVCSKVCLHGWG